MKLDRRSLLAGLAACSFAPRRAKAVPFKDASGRIVDLPAKITKVFPAGPPAAIAVYTLAPDLLLGWTRSPSPAEKDFLLPEAAAKPELGRMTGRGNTANLEAVIAQKPDLILDIGSTSATFVSLADRVREQTGIPYVLLDGKFDATADSYRQLGKILDRAERAEMLAAFAEKTFATISGRVARIPDAQRPRVYFARGTRGLETGLGGSINVESIEMLARNVAGETKGGMATVSVEQVLAWNPDVIVTIEAGFAARVKQDAAWSAVRAVKEGRVYLSPNLPFGWIDFPPAANRLIGLWWLAKKLYPAQFPEDLHKLTREFYQLFYHIELTDQQLVRVLPDQL